MSEIIDQEKIISPQSDSPLSQRRKSGSLSDDAHNCTLFIGDIPRRCNTTQLKQFFEKAGEVVVADIKKDKSSNLSLGYGFVQYRTREQAEKALQTLDGSILMERKIRIGWAQKKISLFVYYLDPSLAVEQVNNVFGQFEGLIPEETASKGCYFVIKFSSKQLAENAKRQLDGKFWTLESGITADAVEEGAYPIKVSTSQSQKNCVHLKFNAENATFNEASLQEAFSKFGTVVAVNLPKVNGVAYKGFGFIHFEDSAIGEEGAAKAIASLDHKPINGTLIDLNFGRKQPARKPPQRNGGPQHLHGGNGGFPGGNGGNGGPYSSGGGNGNGNGGHNSSSNGNGGGHHHHHHHHHGGGHNGGNGNGGGSGGNSPNGSSNGNGNGNNNGGHRRSFNSYTRSRGGNGGHSHNGGDQQGRGGAGSRYSPRGNYHSGGQSHPHQSANQQGRNYKHPTGFVVPLQQEYFYGYHPYGPAPPMYNPPSYPYPGHTNLSLPMEHYGNFDHTGKSLPKMDSPWYPTDQRTLEEQQQRIQAEADSQSDQNM